LQSWGAGRFSRNPRREIEAPKGANGFSFEVCRRERPFTAEIFGNDGRPALSFVSRSISNISAEWHQVRTSFFSTLSHE
jgi:hypothetical protein